jgi:hypothetical protein
MNISDTLTNDAMTIPEITALVADIRTEVATAVVGMEEAIELARPPQGADDFGGRRLQTQIRVLARTANVLIVLLAVALVLTTFPSVRHVGASLLASAGVAGDDPEQAVRDIVDCYNFRMDGYQLGRALESFGCFRLAARIHELRRDGWQIEERTVETRGGKRVAEYSL